MRKSNESDIFTCVFTSMNRISRIFKSALFAFALSVSAISCSNDEFFGFDDVNYNYKDDNCIIIDSSLLTDYTNYITSYYSFINDVFAIDSSKMSICCVKDEKTVYVKRGKGSLSTVRKNYEKLIKNHPEYKAFSYDQVKSLMNQVYMRNKDVQQIKYDRKGFPRNRDGNPENVQCLTGSHLLQDNVTYLVEDISYPLHTDICSEADALMIASYATATYTLEFSGYAWPDQSGCVFTAGSLTSYSTVLPEVGSPTPKYSFHYHLSGCTEGNSYDFTAFDNLAANCNIKKHAIFSPIGDDYNIYYY